CAAPLPVGETGVASGKGGAAEGNPPACTSAARKAGDTAAPFIATLARARGRSPERFHLKEEGFGLVSARATARQTGRCGYLRSNDEKISATTCSPLAFILYATRAPTSP